MAKHRWFVREGKTPQTCVRCRFCGVKRKLVVPLFVPQHGKPLREGRRFVVYAMPRGKVWSTLQPECVERGSRE